MLESVVKAQVEPVTPQPVIPAGRFVLRPMQKSDAGLIAHYAGDKRVAYNTRSIPHPFPPGAAEGMTTRAAQPSHTEDVWVLDGSAHGLGEVLGLVYLARMERRQSEITFWIAPPFWNTGLASEAVAALIAANPHGDEVIFAEVFQDNPGSARVLTHNGFDYLGDAESFSVARGIIVPTWTYALSLKR